MTEPSARRFIPESISSAATHAPSRPALVQSDRVLDYGTLNRQANQIAHFLRSRGCGPEDRVGVALPRSIDFVLATLGILKSGAAYVPIDPSLPELRQRHIAQDAGLNFSLGEPAFAGALAVSLDSREIQCQPASELPTAEFDAGQLAYVIYTSGSTGSPKGVEVTHGNLLHLVDWHTEAFQVTRKDRATLLANVGFDAAVWELWPYLCAGATLLLPPPEMIRQPEALRDFLVASRISLCFAPTLLAEAFLRLAWPANTMLRALLTGGDTLRTFPAPALPFAVVNNYGPAEATVVSTSGVVPASTEAQGLPSIGRPIAGAHIVLLDEQLEEAAPGSSGEICIGGGGVARGYLNQPELTSERFLMRGAEGGRLYRSGDLGRWNDDGTLQFLGRVDRQVKIRGYRIECEEIEAAVNSIPGVQTSAVTVSQQTDGHRGLVAYVVPLADAALSHGELRRALRALLPEYMVPEQFVRLSHLPLSENGKIDRHQLLLPEFIQPDRRYGRAGRSHRSPTSPAAHRPAGRRPHRAQRRLLPTRRPLLHRRAAHRSHPRPLRGRTEPAHHLRASDADRDGSADRAAHRLGGARARNAECPGQAMSAPTSTDTSVAVTGKGFNSLYQLLDPEILANPYPLYRALRERAPVQWDPYLHAWVVTEYEHVLAVLLHFSADRTPTPAALERYGLSQLAPIAGVMTRQLLFMDPPAHTRLRALAAQAFSVSRVERLAAQIQAILDDLLDGLAGRDSIDIIADLAEPLPAIVTAALLGVPIADYPKLKGWSASFAEVLGNFQHNPDRSLRVLSSLDEMSAYFRDAIRTGSERDGLIRDLATARVDGEQLTEDEVVANVIVTMVGGQETTTNLIGNGMLALLRHPDQLAALRNDPGLLPSAVEELLRFEPPSQHTARLAPADTTLGGQSIRKGQAVIAVMAAANRDPARFPEPDRLDLARVNNRHLSFGWGAHFCFGAHLARLEGRLAFQAILARYPHIALPATPPLWRDNLGLRGMVALPVAVA